MNKIKEHQSKHSLMLSVAALGVVFGDIGTSPLYTMKASLHLLAINELNILGVLSLIFWSLILIISIKYLVIVFRADNHGEGGILALFALLKNRGQINERLLYVLAIFGAGLLLGDGMLTPAISVTSAIEGIDVISPKLNHFVIPISCFIMLILFIMQARGTAKIGAAFGPVIIIWFICIAYLGLIHILENTSVIKAVNPYYAYAFMSTHGWQAYLLLGGIFLVVTGGEALYADIGHFGKSPIRRSWFVLVLPCLLLNYFGQGAYLLAHPEGINNPFFMMSPAWFIPLLLVIATLATIIASQAVITATFSLTKQAILLGYYPRVPIVQTSKDHIGQIFIPQMNMLLLIGTLALILSFKNSSALAHAYGIAVNLDMLLVSSLVSYAAIVIWKWSYIRTFLVFALFISIELLFLGANAHKILTGGWAPIVFALITAFVMHTWNKGMTYLRHNFYDQNENLSKVIRQLHYKSLHHLEGLTTIFITDVYDRSGSSFLHFLKLSRAVPENVMIINYCIKDIPYVDLNKRFELSCLDNNMYHLTLHYGFMDIISIPKALKQAIEMKMLPFKLNIDAVTYLVEMPNIYASKAKKTLWFYWQEQFFAFLMRNNSSNINIDFYQLPYNKTIALGTYYIV